MLTTSHNANPLATFDDGYWLWIYDKEEHNPPDKITGKYLFFHENLDILKEIAIEEIRTGGFRKAKVNNTLLGKSTEHVLCLYSTDDSRKFELAQKYQGWKGVKYRYWKSDDDTRNGKYSQEFLDKLAPSEQYRFKTRTISFSDQSGKEISISLCEGVKPLKLSYELAWRTEKDEKFRESAGWKKLRIKVLERDDFTCQYCGFKMFRGMHVNHIDGNPKNNDLDNLEVICPQCHMVMHSGLWCAVHGVIDCYAKSKFSQNEIISITRKLREEGIPDEEIIKFLGLDKPMPWKQDLEYLSGLYGFITSRTPNTARHSKPLLSEGEQASSLKNRDNW